MQVIEWNEIINKYASVVWQHIYRLLGDYTESADCFSETFVGAWEFSRRHKIRNFEALLIQIATSKAINKIRCRIRRSKLYESGVDVKYAAGSYPEPIEQLYKRELANKLRNSLGRLPAKEAEVFCLRYLNNMSHRQIAKAIGVKTNTICVLLHRAKKKLRELIEPPMQNKRQPLL